MLDKIIAFSIKNKFVIFMMTLSLIIWGVWSATQLPIDAVPDITNNQVQIITICPSLAGQEVEQLVTYPIEQSVTNLPDLVELRSISRFGLSIITVVFEESVDVYFARQLIHERLLDAIDEIPEGIGKPTLAPVSTGLGEVYQYIIHPKPGSEDKYTPSELRTMQDWIVARQLIGTPGIAEVNSFGGSLKQYEVAVNPNRLLAMDVNLSEIFSALEENNENTGGAYIDKKPNAYFIRSIGLISSFQDIENIAVRTNPNGIPILIKDVATVQFGEAVRYGALTYNGEIDAVGGMVMMIKGGNSAEVVKRVKEKMATIQQSLPDDVIIEAFLDRTNLVNRAMYTVEKNLIEGALIVIFVLVIFLGNFRAGLIVASAIPLSLLFALGMMNVFGLSANLMSLGAIDFGLIVDGAVIIVEATLHHLGLRAGMKALSQDEMDEEVYQSASKIRSSAAFGEIIILIVYLPILSLVGIEGKMFSPMAMTVGFAIFGALILSLTYIPMMCAMFLPKTASEKKSFSDKLIAYFYKGYKPLLEKAVQMKKTVITATVVIFALSIFLFSRMGGEFIPKLEEGDFAFHCILPQGTSLSQSIETSMQAARIIKTFDEVKMVVNKTGSAEVPTDPMPPEATDMMIILKDKSDWGRQISYDELAHEIYDALQIMPGVFFETNQPIQMRFNELMTGIRQDVAVKIFGENMDSLVHYAKEVNAIIQNVEGASEPMVERVEGLPQIAIKYNRSQLANYGLNIKDINTVISTSFAGGVAGVVFENERKFDLVVRLEEAYRKDISNVSGLLIPTTNGNQIPLSQVAEVKMEYGPAQISREDGKRRIVVGFNVNNRDVESLVTEIQEKLATQVKLPSGYYFTFGGTFENLQAASKRLLIAVPAALALIFILLYFTFNSVKQAMLIFTAIPMSAIGGILALLLRGMPFSISAGIGFIALFGVAVLNGIVLIGTFNNLKKEGMLNPLDRVFEGTKIRLRPVLMTAIVASLGFLPMALSNSAGAEVQKPLATVVIGGLISATFLTLFVLPLLYLIFIKPIKMKNFFVVLSIVLFTIPFTAFAQDGQYISLEDAIEMAMEKNPNVAAKSLEIDAAKANKKGSFDLPQTEFIFQFGQYNSIERDQAFAVKQRIPFPTSFSSQAKLNQAMVEYKESALALSAQDLEWQVSSWYYQTNFLESLNGKLLEAIQMQENFLALEIQRNQAGETSAIGKIMAETKLKEVEIRYKQNQQALLASYAKLKSLINTTEPFQVSINGNYKNVPKVISSEKENLNDHPQISLLEESAQIVDKKRKNSNAQYLPNIYVGYSNSSFIGVQNVDGVNTNFESSDRFQSFQVGLGIPLAFGSQIAKSKSYQYEKEALLKNKESALLQFEAELQSVLMKHEQLSEQLVYYQEFMLPNAQQLVQLAIVSYRAGEINYLEYLQTLETNLDTEMGYLSTINAAKQNLLHFEYLTQHKN